MVDYYSQCKTECLADGQCMAGTYREMSGFKLCFLYTHGQGELMFPLDGSSFFKRCAGKLFPEIKVWQKRRGALCYI